MLNGITIDFEQTVRIRLDNCDLIKEIVRDEYVIICSVPTAIELRNKLDMFIKDHSLKVNIP